MASSTPPPAASAAAAAAVPPSSIAGEEQEQQEQWTVVTRDDKKRVMRRSRCGGGFGGGRRRRRGKQVSVSMLNAADEGGGGDAPDDSGGRKERLREVLSRCCEEIQTTQFYESLLEELGTWIAGAGIFTEDGGHGSSSDAGDDDHDNDDGGGNLEDRPRMQVACYGVGNFSMSSSSLHSFSAPMWQLACALCLRDWLEDEEEGQKRRQRWHRSPKEGKPKERKEDEDPESTLTSEPAASHRVPLLYYDPCSTAFEEDFLRTLPMTNDNDSSTSTEDGGGKAAQVVDILDSNDRGMRPVASEGASCGTSGTSPPPPPFLTLFFMPHCPQKLYDNVLWSSWDDMSTGSVAIIGNSLLNPPPLFSQPRQPCPCIEALAPWLRQVQLDAPPPSSRRRKHDDAAERSGNFVGAFNDTYLTTKTSPAGEAGDGDSSAQLPWPQRPENVNPSDLDVNDDPELI